VSEIKSVYAPRITDIKVAGFYRKLMILYSWRGYVEAIATKLQENPTVFIASF
jgi:hypothetical protein